MALNRSHSACLLPSGPNKVMRCAKDPDLGFRIVYFKASHAGGRGSHSLVLTKPRDCKHLKGSAQAIYLRPAARQRAELSLELIKS